MAKVYVTGPVHMWAGVGGQDLNSKTPLYLGTGQQAPDIDIKCEWDQVMNDLSGTKLGFDDLYEGTEAMISFVLNRFKYATLLRMMSRPNYAQGTPGMEVSGDVGTLMGHENMTFPFWCKFPYNAKPFQNDMPAGLRFWSCKLLSPDKIQGGTKDKKIHCIVHAKRAFTNKSSPLGGPSIVYNGGGAASVNNLDGGTFKLYDYDMNGLPAFD